MALPYTVDHLALFPCPTAFIHTFQLLVSWVTFTPSPTGIISPKGCPCRNVTSLVGTAALIGAHTAVSTQYKAFLAGAGLNTGVFAFGGSIRVGTGSWTGTAAKFIAAVGGTFDIFREERELCQRIRV